MPRKRKGSPSKAAIPDVFRDLLREERGRQSSTTASTSASTPAAAPFRQNRSPARNPTGIVRSRSSAPYPNRAPSSAATGRRIVSYDRTIQREEVSSRRPSQSNQVSRVGTATDDSSMREADRPVPSRNRIVRTQAPKVMAFVKGKDRKREPVAPEPRASSLKRPLESTHKPTDKAVEEQYDEISEAPLKRPKTIMVGAPKGTASRRGSNSRSATGPTPVSRAESPRGNLETDDDSDGTSDGAAQQRIVADDDFDDFDDFNDSDEESDLEWEDVPLVPSHTRPKAVEIEWTPSNPQQATSSRSKKRSSVATRKERIAAHKAHLVLLFLHGLVRNQLCNNELLQCRLAALVPTKVRKLFRDKEEWTDPQRNQMFVNGLQEAQKWWTDMFTITKRGLQAPIHAPEATTRDKADRGSTLEKAQIRELIGRAETKMEESSKSFSGSSDFGAQLFCAMLRGLGIETRLVFSLQVTPLSGLKAAEDAPPSGPATQTRRGRPGVETIYFNSSDSDSDSRLKDPTAKKLSRDQKPVFWVEALTPVSQQWIPVDALCTLSVNRPFLLDPPISLKYNKMTYVFAYEASGTVVDVTRRYSKSFNARTRRLRLDHIDSERPFFQSLLRSFFRRPRLPRDDIESSFFISRQKSEGLPRSLQGFRGHPLYVLERHVRHNEVISPRVEVGRVCIGVGAAQGQEPVFRRQDVHVVRSADRWYREGRDVKSGEAPLKIARKKPRRAVQKPWERDQPLPEVSEDAVEKVPLFAFYQTELYIPPPVVDGMVPKNEFGNLDVYVPSMLPAGAAHIPSPLAWRAARFLRVDYAEVITGFSFSAAGAAATKAGIAVAEEFAPAVADAVTSLEDEAEDERLAQRRLEVALQWARLLDFLRVSAHVDEQYRTQQDRDARNADGANEWADRPDAWWRAAIADECAAAEEARRRAADADLWAKYQAELRRREGWAAARLARLRARYDVEDVVHRREAECGAYGEGWADGAGTSGDGFDDGGAGAGAGGGFFGEGEGEGYDHVGGFCVEEEGGDGGRAGGGFLDPTDMSLYGLATDGEPGGRAQVAEAAAASGWGSSAGGGEEGLIGGLEEEKDDDDDDDDSDAGTASGGAETASAEPSETELPALPTTVVGGGSVEGEREQESVQLAAEEAAVAAAEEDGEGEGEKEGEERRSALAPAPVSDDRGSLLSEDPEDCDAVPMWMVDEDGEMV